MCECMREREKLREIEREIENQAREMPSKREEGRGGDSTKVKAR
jgi:hypothetical protein